MREINHNLHFTGGSDVVGEAMLEHRGRVLVVLMVFEYFALVSVPLNLSLSPSATYDHQAMLYPSEDKPTSCTHWNSVLLLLKYAYIEIRSRHLAESC